MLIKYKDAAYNNKIENLRNNGYTVNFVDFDYDDFVMEEGNPVPFIELQLPNGGKSYNDYTAIVAWSNYVENSHDLSTRTHSGMPVPSSFTVQDGDTPVNCYYVIEDTATEGVVRFSRIITSQGPFSNEDFSDFVGNLCGLMFIEGDEHNLEPDTSLIVPNLEAFFAQASRTADFQLDIANKTKLLSLGDNEDFPAYRCYKIIPSIPHGESSEIEFDGTSYHTENSSYQLLPLPIDGILDLTGITEEDLATKSKAEIYEIAKSNSDKITSTVTNETFGCLNLEKGLIYPVARSLTLKNNLYIKGNGATLLAYDMITRSCGRLERRVMSFINNINAEASISNVTFEDLTFRGGFPFYDCDNQPIGDGETGFVGDQCIYTQAEYPLIKNLRFENVNFNGFKFAVHTGKSENTVYNAENCNWKFNNCDFTDVETGFMLSWVQGVTVTNSHIDNSIAKDDLHHCMYIARGSSYITVDNCLLENSIGGGIDFGDTTKATDEKKMHHCSFTNLQIRNCRVAVTIGSPSEDIVVKNIYATNVGRALKLGNCKRVTIDNFNATGSFYYDFIRKDADGETCFPNTDGEWSGISVWGYADAKITNSFFSTGGAMFTSQKSGLLPDELASQPVRTTLEFDNCIFVSTFSEHKPGSDGVSYYQPGASLGVNNSDLAQPYVYNVDFNNCQFYMNSENNERSMIALKGYDGNDSEKSVYKFTDCLVAYRDGNGTPEDNHPEKADSMPDGFFIYPDKGTWVEIEDCVFYVNKANATNSSECGFVMNKYLYMDEIESDKERCLIKSYSKYHLFT